MRDHDRGGLLAQQLLEKRDAVEVQMIGRLVEQHEIGREREGERKRRTLAFAARGLTGRRRLVKAEAMQVLDEPRLGAPVLALVQELAELAAKREAFTHGGRGRKRRLLLHEHGAKAVAPLDLAVVEVARAVDHVKQRGLAGAVAPDEADVLAVIHDERRPVEEGMQSERELGVL